MKKKKMSGLTNVAVLYWRTTLCDCIVLSFVKYYNHMQILLLILEVNY